VASRVSFCLSSTPNPPTRKMVVQPYSNRNRKIVWCSILHEEQLFIFVTLWNNGKHEIVKHIQALSDLVYNHPAVCIFSEIPISKRPSRAFMHHSGLINERYICGNRTQKKMKMSSFSLWIFKGHFSSNNTLLQSGLFSATSNLFLQRNHQKCYPYIASGKVTSFCILMFSVWEIRCDNS